MQDNQSVIIIVNKILFISFFLYFIIVRKSVRTVKQENHGINGNKEISFDSTKKRIFLIYSNNGYIDRYDEEVVPHTIVSNLLGIC
jgi:uncharacterized membrane protein